MAQVMGGDGLNEGLYCGTGEKGQVGLYYVLVSSSLITD